MSASRRGGAADGNDAVDEDAAAPAFASPAALRAWLHERGVPTDAWGVAASAKSVEDLFGEIAAGESAMLQVCGCALRSVRVVSLTLAAPRRPSPSSPPLVLAEACQVLPDGRVRKRGLLPLSEKMRAGEGWVEAALRGVREELGSAAAAARAAAGGPPGATAAAAPAPPPGLVALDLPTHSVELGPAREAASYPGLPTLYEVHRARGELSGEAFAAVLPEALQLLQRRQEGGGGPGDGEGAATPPPPLEFETVEAAPGGRLLRTTWRWVDERELGGGGTGGAG